MGHSKRFREAVGLIDRNASLPVTECVETLKKLPGPKFDETIEIAINTGLDPTKADQALRGTISLPKGIGKSQRVVVFCEADQVEPAKAAGATEAGGEDLVEKVQGGWLDFDVAVAQPQMMRFVGKLGRVLGPKGLMPSPKSGTVTPDVVTAVQEFAAGKIEYRLDKGGNIHAPVGKRSFETADLVENIQAFIDHIRRAKPSGSKGRYIQGVSLSSSMGPGLKVAV
jgi:large subunit ribosomal protein L1